MTKLAIISPVDMERILLRLGCIRQVGSHALFAHPTMLDYQRQHRAFEILSKDKNEGAS